jgi:hypothetical protein
VARGQKFLSINDLLEHTGVKEAINQAGLLKSCDFSDFIEGFDSLRL